MISKDIHEADIVIAISHKDGMKIVKNRSGNSNIKLDLVKILEAFLPYQEHYLHPLIKAWIDKLKIYRTFS